MDFIRGKYEMQGCCPYLLGIIARFTRLKVRDLKYVHIQILKTYIAYV